MVNDKTVNSGITRTKGIASEKRVFEIDLYGTASWKLLRGGHRGGVGSWAPQTLHPRTPP